ncbi:MAG: hypothetical protein ACXVRV_13535, partial [Gaiellaceae bacterium]
MAAGRLTITDCVAGFGDKARFGGQFYSDKAPGLSLLALPVVEVVRLPARPAEWEIGHQRRAWLVRVATSGVAFLVLAFLLGRVAEGLVRGSGAVTAVAFALATFASGLAATTFDQLPAAALGFGAFLLAWNRRPLFAGLLAGLAVTTEYQAALVAVLLAVYVGVRGLRSVVEYAIGAFVGVVPLALYDWAAFGSPLHASYRYVANGYKEEQASGFFGISTPRFGSIHDVLIGDRGLLITSPVLLIAALGLAILFVRRPREALVAIFVSASFLLLEFGYFLPYGGISPGPRFFAPALPFLLLGLVPAWEKLKPVASAALLVSV